MGAAQAASGRRWPCEDGGGAAVVEVRAVSQARFELRDGSGRSAFDAARECALAWVDDKTGGRVPAEGREGGAFVLGEVDGQRAQGAVGEAPRRWALRFDDADASTPRRVWTTEVAIAEAGSGVSLFAARLVCAALGEGARFPRSMPRLVREVVSGGRAFLGGVPVGVEPWEVGPDEVDRLVEVLTDRTREVDVVVFSVGGDRDVRGGGRACAGAVARMATGAVHVVVLEEDASFVLSDRLGKEFSVFGGAVRTYRPGFDPDVDDRYAHPLARRRPIAEWRERHGLGFRAFLVQQMLGRSVAGLPAVGRPGACEEVWALGGG